MGSKLGKKKEKQFVVKKKVIIRTDLKEKKNV